MKSSFDINKIYITLVVLLILVIVVVPFIPHNTVLHELLDRYTKVFTLLSFISLTIGIIGIFFSYLSYQDTQKNNNFNVVNSCMIRFTNILPGLIKLENYRDLDVNEVDTIILQYYNLTEEQLFYIRLNIVPDYIKDLWIIGMKNQINNLRELDTSYIQTQYTDNHPLLIQFVQTITDTPTISISQLKNHIMTLRV